MSLLKVRVIALVLGLVVSTAWGQTFESLYSFPADGTAGMRPYATLALGSDGNMYGTTTVGGANDDGTVFRVSTTGEVTILNSFEETTTGKFASSQLLNIGDGYLYGVTEANGTVAGGPAGTVFRLDPLTGQLQPVFQIPGNGNDTPKKPQALTMGEPNTLHVVCFDRAGIWRVPLDGVTGASIAYTFTATDGTASANTITRGADGFLYGTTRDAGTQSFGSIFRIAPDGTGMTRLYNGNRTTGGRPYSTLVQAPDGNFYGTMEDGGPDNGCIYRLTPDGEYQVVYYFDSTPKFTDLRYPHGDLMIATDGMLYGTTFGGGKYGVGGIFRIKTDGTGYKILHSFDTTQGREPEGGLVQAGDGNLYGTTVRGGTNDVGTVFRLKLNLPPPPVNSLPVAVDDLAVSTGNAVLIDVLTNDFDPNDDALTVEIKDAPSAGTATVQAGGQILYTPNANYAGTDTFTYKVSDGRGGTASARVRITSTTPGPLVREGVYNGLLVLDPELDLQGDVPRAQFVLAVREGGSFTGVLYSQKKRVPFRGTFDTDGVAVTALKMPDKKLAVLFLAFRAGEPNTIVGALFGSEIWSGEAGPVRNSDSSTTENHTVITGSDPTLAGGYGYGIMKVSPNGLVAAVGKLGDGTKFSWGSALVSLSSRPLALPVFSEPLKGGVCSGVLTPHELPALTTTAFPGQDSSGLRGALRWVRPAAAKPNKPYALGFNGEVEVWTSHFVRPSTTSGLLNIDSGIATLRYGPVQGAVNGEFTIDGNKVRTSSPLRSLSFNRKTGLFSGKMQVGSKTLKFQGIVGQTLRLGFGQFSFEGETGSVLLQPVIVFTAPPKEETPPLEDFPILN